MVRPSSGCVVVGPGVVEANRKSNRRSVVDTTAPKRRWRMRHHSAEPFSSQSVDLTGPLLWAQSSGTVHGSESPDKPHRRCDVNGVTLTEHESGDSIVLNGIVSCP